MALDKGKAVQDIVDLFTRPVAKDGLEKMSLSLLEQFNKGLKKEDHDGEVKMLITYVHDLPDGTENGDFLALDLGGSNFRVLKITLDAENKEISQVDSQVKISDEVKRSDQKTLFNFISDSLAGFIRDQKIDNVLPLGFTFSFPVRQTNLTAGTLIHWTKDFTAKDCEGHDVIVMLNDASKRQKNPPTDVVALVNDTTGTQMAVGYGDKECHVGVILGTGTNACYTEKLDKVEKFTGNKSDYDKVIINTEWGAFGDKGSLDGTHIVNKYDEALDSQEEVTNKKTQIYEKLISGKYLGEIVRHVLLELIKEKVLFGGNSSDVLNKFEGFKSSYLSDIEGDDGLKACRDVLVEKCGLATVSDEDCGYVKLICQAVSTRAARLSAAGIVTIIRKMGKLDKCTVAIDGSLYKLHPTFRFKMRAAINELAPCNGIIIKESRDGSGRGAAMVAAVACRLKNKV